MAAERSEYELSHDREGVKTAITTELDQDTRSPSPADFGEAPDGGLRAWLVIAGATCIYFSSLGFSNAFGVFQQYYMAHQLHDKTPDYIAWIGSLAAFFQLGSGAIGGPLFDRFGAWIIWPAAVLYVFALMMLSLCYRYWQFMLTQCALPWPQSQYFDKKRGLSLGVAVSGTSIGGILFPIALARMLHSPLGFGWAIRIIGFIILPLVSFSCVAIKSRLPPRTTVFFIGAAFKKPVYIFLTLSLFFMYLGMFPPLFFIPTYAVTRGVNAKLTSYLPAIINAASFFGRLIPGLLADKFGRLNIFSLAGIMSGIVIICMNSAKTKAALIVYSLAFGFSSGTIVSSGSAAFTLCPKDPRDIGTYLGMGMAVSSVAALVASPIGGALIDQYDGFLPMAVFSGIMCIVGGLFAMASKASTPQGLLGKI